MKATLPAGLKNLSYTERRAINRFVKEARRRAEKETAFYENRYGYPFIVGKSLPGHRKFVASVAIGKHLNELQKQMRLANPK